MKLINTLVLAAAFALSLVACSTSEKKAATEHPTSEPPAAAPADGAAGVAEHPTEHPASTPPAADAPKAE